jgi:ribulose-5-phosphate 4-epimerase/fuculose-1-phosphate aldolase
MAIPDERILDALKPTIIFPIREVHNSPSGEEIKKIGKKVSETFKVDGVVAGSISTTFANGFIITTSNVNVNLAKISETEITEILEYDPVRNNVIAKGKKDPCVEISLHWFIYRGFNNIGAIIHVRNTEFAEKLMDLKLDEVPVTPFKIKFITSELAMEVLKVIKGHNSVILLDNGILTIGRDLDDALDKIVEISKKVVEK